MLLAIDILFGVNCILFFIFHKFLKLTWKEISRALLYGMLVAVIIKGFVYGIGKELNIDFYFFEVRILGKNALENFENTYISLIQKFSIEYSFIYVIGIIILPATLEEIGKLLALRFITPRDSIWSVPTVRAYIYRMFTIAIGFSLLENLVYLNYYHEQGLAGIELVQLITLRIIMSTSSHLFFSGILAYFYARFMFGKYDLVDTGGFTTHKRIVEFLKSIHLFYSPFFTFAYNSRLLLIGLVIAIGGHIFYNLMIHLQLSIIALGFLIISWSIFLYILHTSIIMDKNLGLIQEKIGIMKELRRVQKRKDELFGEK